MGRKVNEDLAKERWSCGIKSDEFTAWWYGGWDKVAEKRKYESILKHPEVQHDIPLHYLSHKEMYEEKVRQSTEVLKKVKELREADMNPDEYNDFLGKMEILGMLGTSSPIEVHFSMFIPTIMSQATEEQQKKWLKRALRGEIIGTYAQTEMGHGTFIRGLQTTATYDEKSQEFILNSPQISAFKFWPGGLGHTANCAIVMAQLIIRGERQGIFPFFVQIRDENTHMPLRGVKVGDIGAKMGLKSTNNGFLGFTNHRIPRENMLMKNAQVLEDGTFVKAPMSVLTYGTMVFVRVMIVRDMSNRLAQAATIATRYSAVRKQSPINPDEPEPQILDHVTQQNKIFPQLAKSVIFKLAADLIIDIYNSVNSDLARGKHDRLPELHALSCALKAISSTDAVAGVEICRLSCGGHGYLECSGFPTLLGFVAAAYTYEGENTVLLLQTARFLMKAAKDPDLSPTVAFLKRYPDYKIKKRWDGSIGGMIEAFEAVAAAKIRIAAESVEQRIREGKKPGTAANLSSIELVAAADAHCRAFILRAGAESMEKVSKSVSPALAGVLKDLLELYAVDAAKKALGDLLCFTTITEGDIGQLQKRLEDVLARLRPNAVAIVDGFDFPDEVLKSALGAYDGNVYERIYEDAMKSPLNYEPVNASFHKYLKPFTKGNSKL
ncbi:probable peroxisomal acyl-coenzyme A oxidase 1 isoform X2 [Lutzomyia longipalpis]|uniref:probable peroxisomal acyl-coenzyme A oxidase 1 isoform X2 n=1 Tax=Lutzomyia longipalpis TaxID=7200 RepID=UPI00248372EF|nr:probable peroxisomal acyl-coenzyme A oxidase 1 isoform X2 [Lutzomyia longipalpis]